MRKFAEAGFDVLVLEEGPNIPKEDGPAPAQKRKMLNEREVEMYKLLYQEGATHLTQNGGVKVLQGRCLGGGTAVKWSACLPPRKETQDEWQKRGLPFTRQNLDPYLREVVNYLPIVRNDKYNTSARKFMLGCSKHDSKHDALAEPVLHRLQNGPGKRYSMASDAGDGGRSPDGCLSKEVQTELGILVVPPKQCAVDCLGCMIVRLRSYLQFCLAFLNVRGAMKNRPQEN